MAVDELFTRFYFSRPEFKNGTQQFHDLVSRQIQCGAAILEVGAGPANRTTRFLSSIGTVVGVDISDEILTNEALAEAYLYDGQRFPLANEAFDACVSNYVLEHVTKPEIHFREVYRILRPGGVFCFRTPNLWHYVTLGSWLIPNRAHNFISNRLRALGPHAHAVYPTSYRANTPRRIRSLAAEAGFRLVLLDTLEAEPSYAKASSILFYPMMIYERVVNCSKWFGSFRSNILCVLEKSLLLLVSSDLIIPMASSALS
jgi:SAM-dependent methyltransferase